MNRHALTHHFSFSAQRGIGAVIFCTASLAYDHSRLPKYKNTLPKYTTWFLSDTKVNHSTATSEWHFKWHAGKVRIVGRGTPHPGHNEGVALYKEGPHLKVNVLSGINQHYWDINYKPGAHGTNRFQIAFACNFAGAANGTCEGEGNELVVYGPNSNAMRFENSKYDSPHASWWEYELDGQ